jgi:glutamate synthase (NADPH/NADH) small chain
MKKTIIPLYAFLEQVRKEPQKRSQDERIRHFASIYTQFKQQEAATQTERCIDCGNPYCQWKCPLHNYIPDWLRLVAEGKIMEAADLAHLTNTLPEVCGQVCPQELLCEGACTLNDDFGAVTIGAIENYLTETALQQGWKPNLSLVKKTDYRVAIIGAGPSGLACADKLTHLGIAATVYDKHPEIGGLLTFGIPEFKLDKAIMTRRRKIFEDMGIRFALNQPIHHADQVHKLLDNYDALFLGLGTEQGITANVPGENLLGVYPALPFLVKKISHSLGFDKSRPIDLNNKKVMVLGAGDTAMDCSRTAIRMGAASVTCVYRRGEEHRQGAKKDYKHAIEEGVEFQWWQQAIAFHGQKKVEHIALARTSLDDNFNLLIDTQHQIMPVDVVIIAYGFEAMPHPWFNDFGIETHNKGLVFTDEKKILPLQTTHEKIFAGGDLILGANLVVNAIAHGNIAAKSILTLLQK